MSDQTSGDPLAAEIAAHQRCSCLADRGRHCLACGEPWPCLVRRLADVIASWQDTAAALVGRVERAEAERDALRVAGNAMAGV